MRVMTRKKIAGCSLTLLLLLCGFAALIAAQTPTPNVKPKAAQGSVSGRITIAGEAAANVPVALVRVGRWDEKAVSRSSTDGAGYYQLTRISPGSYGVIPLAPAHVAPRDLTFGLPGKPVTVSADEQITGIDIALEPGGVITGRVTDEDDNPVIGERVTLMPVASEGERRNMNFISGDNETDDQGIYRIFGLPAGRYVVSVGHDAAAGHLNMGGGGGVFYTRTFHPAARDEAKAKFIEVRAGEEASNVDIKLGSTSSTFTASGRILDKETGKPIVNADYAYGALQPDGKHIGAYGYTGARTNARGEFRLDALAPGRYAVFLRPNSESNLYSDAAAFDIKDADVSGLEVKASVASEIRGVVHLETKERRGARTPDFTLQSYTETAALGVPYNAPTKVNADGSFRIGGVRPGKTTIYLGGYPPPKGVTLLRLERDGVELRNGVEISSGGEIVTGVRVVLAYGTGVITGQVVIVGGTLPEGVQLHITPRHTGDSTNQYVNQIMADTRGRFRLENLVAGDYELTLNIHYTRTPAADAPRFNVPVKQNVTVSGEGETQVTLTLDLAPPAERAP